MAAKPVIAGTDGSPESVRAVQWAAREAMLRGTSLQLLAVPSLPPRMSPNPRVHETVAGTVEQSISEALAAAAQEAAQAAPGLTVETHLRAGSPAQELVEAGNDALMLVVGSRGSGGFSAMILGSVSRYVATHAACPVVVVREETSSRQREIVVGVRDPDQAGPALGFAFEAAALRKARLVAVHAWAWSVPGSHEVPSEEESRLEGLLATWRDKHPGVEARAEVMHAHPGKVLAGASARADLVVLGRHPAGAPARARSPLGHPPGARSCPRPGGLGSRVAGSGVATG
jgi:nucleotide-binding universal stress UspA family protein